MAGFVRAQNFPQAFLGHWTGELLWHQAGKKEPQKIQMHLIVQPADTAGHYTWQIVYGDNNQDNRPYVLKPVDTARGHWVIDERNGIVLDQYWIGNRLSGAFRVQTSTILNSYRVEGDRLMIEFFNLTTEPVGKTGGTSKDVPVVESFGIKSFQQAVLRRRDVEKS